MFDFSNEKPSTGVQYLRTAGTHTGAQLVELVYDATATYESFDIKLDVNGVSFRDKTFAPKQDKVYPAKKYDKGQVVGEETQEEAYQRAWKEVFFKLAYLVSAFVGEEKTMTELGKFDGMKDLVDKANNLINSGDTSTKLNIVVGWKNNDSTQKSNLTIPDRGAKWVEATQYNADRTVKTPTVKFKSSAQETRMMEERYPYGGTNNESTNSDSVILNNISSTDDSLPF